MKCVRKVGWNIQYSVWRAQCKRWRKVRKTQKYDVSFLRYDLPRYRMRRRALDMIGKSNNLKIYQQVHCHLINQYIQSGNYRRDILKRLKAD